MMIVFEKKFKPLKVFKTVNMLDKLSDRAIFAEEQLLIPESHVKELEHRHRLYQADPQRAIPWAQAKAGILKRRMM